MDLLDIGIEYEVISKDKASRQANRAARKQRRLDKPAPRLQRAAEAEKRIAERTHIRATTNPDLPYTRADKRTPYQAWRKTIGTLGKVPGTVENAKQAAAHGQKIVDQIDPVRVERISENVRQTAGHIEGASKSPLADAAQKVASKKLSVGGATKALPLLAIPAALGASALKSRSNSKQLVAAAKRRHQVNMAAIGAGSGLGLAGIAANRREKVAKAGSDYEKWLSAQPGNPKLGQGPMATGMNKKARQKANRQAYREHLRTTQGGSGPSTARADLREYDATQRAVRTQARAANAAAAESERTAKRLKRKQDIISRGTASGELKAPTGVRGKVLQQTTKPRSRAAKVLSAMAAGAVPGAMAGMAAGGPIGGAIGGALGASAAYPAASYGMNLSTMKMNPKTGRPQHRYREGTQKELFHHGMEDAKRKGGSVGEQMQHTNRNLDPHLPGAARRRLGAMAYGSAHIGRFAAPVAAGGAAAGGLAGAAVLARRRAKARAAAAARPSARLGRALATPKGALALGAGGLAAGTLLGNRTAA